MNETTRKLFYVDFKERVVTNEVTIINEPQEMPSEFEGWPEGYEDETAEVN